MLQLRWKHALTGLLCVAGIAVGSVSTTSSALADEPYVHVVYPGQRLGSIAKRYNVSIDALCAANGITRRDPIRPGQKLVIPGKSAAGKKAPEPSPPAPGESEGSKSKGSPPNAKTAPDSEPRSERSVSPKPPLKHKVYKGQRLGSIAKRYNVSVEAICHASGIALGDPIHPGDTLLIPGKGDENGNYARQLRMNGQVSVVEHPKETQRAKAERDTSWRKYQKAPWKRGYVTLVGFNESWKGFAIGPNGEVLPRAREEISRVLAATGERPRIQSRLIALLAKVSDTFGGRPLRVVSGYRERSYAAASRHRTGSALDFSVLGVPNEAVRDYMRGFDNVGVGYYPNSSFVHLDVREADTYWIDYSGPGEAPQYRHADAHEHVESNE
ncbi:MAG TPA: LysM peptidoglycan-binding domain-containing protein [Polyangiaceae bacterium]|nr:LysM peptidoglycan-binding domain-containing protein [Polyangiaceae bacterium]